MKRPAKNRTRVSVSCTDGGAHQSFQDECDINNILARHQAGGTITHLAKAEPIWSDVSELPDYRTALDQVRTVREYFADLPSSVRAEFDNDPAQFMDRAHEPETVEFLRSKGLVPPVPETAPAPSEAPQGASDEEGADNEAEG